MPNSLERAPAPPLSPKSFRARVAIVAGTGAAALIAMLFVPPIAQDPHYHDFADGRTMLGVPNFLDVASNAPFAIVAAMGLAAAWSSRRPGAALAAVDKADRRAFTVLFAGVGLIAVGSAYYHLDPTNGRLFWDRLPMTIAFMALFAITIAERIDRRVGSALLVPLLAAGAGSTLYWHFTDDLRPYALVQFYPMLAVPLLLLLFPARFTGGRWLWLTLGAYAVAKLFEALDAPIFALGGIVSGHTLKHLAAVGATYCIYRMFLVRRWCASPQTSSGMT